MLCSTSVCCQSALLHLILLDQSLGGRLSGVLDFHRPIRPRTALIASLRHVEPHDTAIYIHAHRHELLRCRHIPHREGAIKGDELLFSRDRPAVIVSRMIRPSAWLPSASSARWLQPALVGSTQAKLVSRLQRRHGSSHSRSLLCRDPKEARADKAIMTPTVTTVHSSAQHVL